MHIKKMDYMFLHINNLILFHILPGWATRDTSGIILCRWYNYPVPDLPNRISQQLGRMQSNAIRPILNLVPT